MNAEFVKNDNIEETGKRDNKKEIAAIKTTIIFINLNDEYFLKKSFDIIISFFKL